MTRPVLGARGSTVLSAWALGLVALACADLPVAAPDAEIRFEVRVDAPEALPIGLPSVLKATVTDPWGNEVRGVDLSWRAGDDGSVPVALFGVGGDSAVVTPRAAGSLVMVAEIVGQDQFSGSGESGPITTGYVDMSFDVEIPEPDSVLVSLSPVSWIVQARAAGSEGVPPDGLRAAVLQGGQLGALTLGGGYLNFSPALPDTGEVAVELTHVDCLGPCADTVTFTLRPEPADLVFSYGCCGVQEFRLRSLEDTADLSAIVVDRDGNELRAAAGVWRSSGPVVSVVDSLAGRVVARANGLQDVQFVDRDSGLESRTPVVVQQAAYVWEFRDVPLYLVGLGRTDTIFLYREDANGFPVESGVDPPHWWIPTDGPPKLTILEASDSSVIVRADERGQEIVAADFTACLESESGPDFCTRRSRMVGVSVVPEPDSVQTIWSRDGTTGDAYTIQGLGERIAALDGIIYLPDGSSVVSPLEFEVQDTTVLRITDLRIISTLSYGTTDIVGRVGQAADTISVTVVPPGS